MAFLMRVSRADLCQLVKELAEETPEKVTKVQLSKIFLVYSDYEEIRTRNS